MNNSTQPLSFGQIIMISPVSNKNSFLYSDGFINQKVSLIQENFLTGTASNYHSLFQVFPTFMNNHKSNALKLLQPNIQSKKIEIEDGVDKLILEYKLNQETCEKLMNTPISYESHIQFFHIASNKYLACYFEEAESEKENFKLVLSDYPSEKSYFKILPVYAHQKRRDGIIYLSDTVYIVTAHQYLNKIPYLRVADEVKSRKKRKKISKKYSHDSNWYDDFSIMKRSSNFNAYYKQEIRFSDDYGLERVRSDEFNTFRKNVESKNFKVYNREANVSLEKKSLFSIIFFSEENNPNFIYFGNIIWLHYSELNLSLIALKGEHGDKVSLIPSQLGEIGSQSIVNSNGMWILENYNPNSGGLVKWEYPLRIKHYGTGKYLSITKENDNYHLYLGNTANEENIFTFSYLPSASQDIQKQITKDSFMKIRHYSSKLWLQIIPKEMISSSGKAEQSKVYNFTDKIIDEVAFKIYKANHSEILETNFLLSSKPILQESINFYENMLPLKMEEKKGKYFNKNEKMISQLETCLGNLEMFTLNKILNTSPEQIYGKINPLRQKVLQEQEFIDLLIRLINCVVTNEEYKEVKKY